MNEDILIFCSDDTVLEKLLRCDCFSSFDHCKLKFIVQHKTNEQARETKNLNVTSIDYNPKPDSLVRKLALKAVLYRTSAHSDTYKDLLGDNLSLFRKFIYSFMNLEIVNAILLPILNRVKEENIDLFRLLEPYKGKKLLLFTGSSSKLNDTILYCAKRFNIESYLVPVGWDNITSKMTFLSKPDNVIERGLENQSYAEKILDLPNKKVFRVGTPWYERFYEFQRNENLAMQRNEYFQKYRIDPSKKLILFGGALRPFNETKFLQLLDDAIKHGEIPECAILYRPHPMRNRRAQEKGFFEFEFKNIHFDKELVETYKAKKEYGLPSLEEFEKIYNAVDGVISPYSSVMLEASIFGKPVMGLGCSDNANADDIWSITRIKKREHFKTLKSQPWFISCDNENEFIEDVKALFKVIDADYSDSIKNVASDIIFHDSSSYSKRLLEITTNASEEYI